MCLGVLGYAPRDRGDRLIGHRHRLAPRALISGLVDVTVVTGKIAVTVHL